MRNFVGKLEFSTTYTLLRLLTSLIMNFSSESIELMSRWSQGFESEFVEARYPVLFDLVSEKWIDFMPYIPDCTGMRRKLLNDLSLLLYWGEAETFSHEAEVLHVISYDNEGTCIPWASKPVWELTVLLRTVLLQCRVSMAQRQSVGLGIDKSRVRNSLVLSGFPLGYEINRHW